MLDPFQILLYQLISNSGAVTVGLGMLWSVKLFLLKELALEFVRICYEPMQYKKK